MRIYYRIFEKNFFTIEEEEYIEDDFQIPLTDFIVILVNLNINIGL